MEETEKRIIPTVNALISNNDGKILLVKRSKENRTNQGKWQVPGGKIDFGETPEQAMQRELTEEIGCKPTSLDLRGATTGYMQVQNVQVHLVSIVFKASISGKIKLSKDHDEFKWMAYEEALTQDLFPGTKEILEKGMR